MKQLKLTVKVIIMPRLCGSLPVANLQTQVFGIIRPIQNHVNNTKWEFESK